MRLFLQRSFKVCLVPLSGRKRFTLQGKIRIHSTTILLVARGERWVGVVLMRSTDDRQKRDGDSVINTATKPILLYAAKHRETYNGFDGFRALIPARYLYTWDKRRMSPTTPDSLP